MKHTADLPMPPLRAIENRYDVSLSDHLRRGRSSESSALPKTVSMTIGPDRYRFEINQEFEISAVTDGCVLDSFTPAPQFARVRRLGKDKGLDTPMSVTQDPHNNAFDTFHALRAAIPNLGVATMNLLKTLGTPVRTVDHLAIGSEPVEEQDNTISRKVAFLIGKAAELGRPELKLQAHMRMIERPGFKFGIDAPSLPREIVVREIVGNCYREINVTKVTARKFAALDAALQGLYHGNAPALPRRQPVRV